MTGSLTIAACALAFTVSAFWWLNARRGKLVAYVPEAFSWVNTAGTFRFRLPFAIYNTGARAIVLVDLRLRFPADGEAVPVITYRHSLRTAKDDVDDVVYPTPIGGRTAVMRFFEFGSDDWSPPQRDTDEVALELKDDRGAWTEVLRFEFDPPPASKTGQYIAHRRRWRS